MAHQPTRDRPRACIVGAGPVGLSAAESLSQAGFDVTVVHRDPIGRRSATSAGPAAAGLIEPVAVDPRDNDLVTALFRESYLRWLPASSESGVDRRTVVYRAASEADRPDWLDVVNELPHSDPATWRFATAVVTPSIWFEHTRNMLRLRQVRFREIDLADWEAVTRLSRQFDIVVNASGPGAWTLGDRDMFGKRGVIVWVEPHPLLQHVVFDASTFTYAIPQRNLVALGGTQDEHFGNPHTWDRAPSATDIEDLLARIRQTPGLPDPSELRVNAVTCDYRPARGRIRIEADTSGRVPVVHATGFGGSGWTLAPSAALRVAGISSKLVGFETVPASGTDG